MLCKFALLTLLVCCYATPPPGYVKPPEFDKYPPKYEYGYTIQDNKGSGQGKLESREGVFSLGRYFVQLGGPKGASQNVEYITDEWGYHPLVEYSSMGDHSTTSTQFALGEKAVEALRKNEKNQISANNHLSQKAQTGVQPPSPTQSTNIPLKSSTPASSPTPVTIQQSSPSPQSNLPKVHHPVQENVPILHNTIPVQYIFQPFNLPQAQYLIQPQVQPSPQPQYYIQEQNIPQTQFLIPLYDTGFDNAPQIHQVNFNIPTQNNVGNQAQTKTEQVKLETKKKETEDNNFEAQKNIAISNQEDKKVTFIVQNNQEQKQNNVISNPKPEFQIFNEQKTVQNIQEQKQNTLKQEYETLRLNNQQQNEKYQTENVNHNNGQYLIEVKEPQQNIVFLPQPQENKTPNIKVESSTVNYNENLKQDQDEIQYLAQAIQNDLNLQNTEPLFGNAASEVKYNSNTNTISSNRFREQNTFDESTSNRFKEQNTFDESTSNRFKEQNTFDESTSNRFKEQNTFDESTSNRFKEQNTFDESTSNRFNEQNNFDESILDLENPGGYGSRIKAKKPNNNINYNNNLFATSVKNNNDIGTKLIDRTRNLVTGADVLNINDAITNYVATASAESQSEQQNKNINNEYNSGQVQYDYNENVPNTILEAVTNFNNKNILNNIHEQSVIVTTADYNKENIVQQSNIETENIESTVTHQQNNLITSSSTYNSKANAIQNGRNKLLEILNSEKVQIQKEQEQKKHVSLSEQPIVVADIESYQENNVQSTTERYNEEKTIAETIYSTTQNTIETKITEDNNLSTESPVLITPRPVSNSFLAPITAAVSLQNSGTDIEDLNQGNYAPETSVEVQESVPYYLGKIEYVESQENYSSQQSSEEEALSTKLIVQENNDSRSSDEQIISEEVSNEYPRAEPLIQNKGQNSINDDDKLSEEFRKENTSVLELKQLLNIDVPTAEAQESKIIVNKPTESTKIIENRYPVQMPIGIPYPIVKQVPVEVEKIVEKPVHITKIVEKPVPVHIPQPYPVEVEKIIEKEVKVPFEVTKYINNPYPVHIPYPEPIAVPVEVERLVQTVVKEPYPVEVPVPYEVPIKVPVPHPVQVTKYIDKPYPVEKIVERPVTIEKIVEKPVTKYIEKPYPVHVHVPVPHPVAVPVEIKVPHPYPVEVTKYIEKPYGLAHAYSIPVPKTVKLPNHHPIQQNKHSVTKLLQIPVEVPKYYEKQIPLYVNLHQQQKQNPYLYAPKYQIEWKNVVNCELNHKHNQNQNHGQYRLAKIQDYIGLVPPVAPTTLDYGKLHSNYKRKARNSFEQNLRIEYGFKPPIIPSIQTDEFGMPLNKEEK